MSDTYGPVFALSGGHTYDQAGQTLKCEEDFDQDGVTNEEDNCPLEKGTLNMGGCPNFEPHDNLADAGTSADGGTPSRPQNPSARKIMDDIKISNSGEFSYEPSLVWAASVFGIAWAYRGDGYDEGIRFVHLNTEGIRIGATTALTISDGTLSGSNDPSLVYAGDGYGISWIRYPEVYFAKLNAVGILENPPIRIDSESTSDRRHATSAPMESSPFTSWTGNEFGVVWHQDDINVHDIIFAQINRQGGIVGEPRLITNNRSSIFNSSVLPNLLWVQGAFTLLWSEFHGQNGSSIQEMRLVRLTVDGSRDSYEGLVETGVVYNWKYAAVWDGSAYGIAFLNWAPENHGWEIYFARFDLSGRLLSQNKQVTRVTNAPRASWMPSLVWTGNEYGLAWNDSRSSLDNTPDGDNNPKLYFVRLDRDGNKIGDEFEVSDIDSGSKPSLVWTGNEYGVAWENDQEGEQNIYFTKLTALP